jgi:integrase
MANVAGYTGKYHVKSEKKDYWFYCLTLGKDADGKRIQIKKRGFKSEREAEKALREAQVAADKGTYIKPTKAAYGEYISEWFETRRSRLGRMTASNDERNIHNHIIPHIGHIQLTEISALHIERLLTELRNKGLAEGTIKKVYSLVSSSLISACKKDILPKNVAALAENKPKVKKKHFEVWDEHEVRYFLEYAQQSVTRYYIALLLALTTGMRQGEILGLRWKDIDTTRKTITVNQTLSHDGKEFKAPKTEFSIRSIKLDDDTLEVLKQHKKAILREKWEAQDSYIDNDLVVCTTHGTPCMPRDLDKRWTKLRKDAKLRKITFHDLRHTHASLLLKNNVHPKVVSERLGHSSIQITLDLYSHLFPNLQEDAAAGLGQMLFQNKKAATKEAN